MDKDISAKRVAYSLLKKHKLGVPTLDEIVFIIKSYGFEVIDYELDKRSVGVDTLINELSLQSFAATGKAFTYQKEDVKLLFVCDSMSANEKKYALAHELGHIACGHLKNGVCNKANMTEEFEANEFAHYLLYPGKNIKAKQWARGHKSIIWIVSIVLVAILVTIPILHIVSLQKSYYGEYYVTESGEKYHEKDCIFIKDKSNVHRMTVDEYESSEYEPCQICLPNNSEND